MSKKIEKILKDNALTASKQMQETAKELKSLHVSAKNELCIIFENDFGFSFNEFKKYLKGLNIEVSMCCDYVEEGLPHFVFKMPTHECTCSVKSRNGAMWYSFNGSCNMSWRNDGGMAQYLNRIIEKIQKVPVVSVVEHTPISFLAKNPLAFASKNSEGMTLLDYFAGVALPLVKAEMSTYKAEAEWAYEVADAMLEARQKFIK